MKRKIYIQGMHCVSCEMLIEDEFKKVTGVKYVYVDRINNLAEIDYEGKELDFLEIKKRAEKFGYSVSLEKFNQKNISRKTKIVQWIKAAAIILVLLSLYEFFQSLGILDKIDLKSSKITYGVSFIIGLTASISSCLAVVGAVIIAFSERYKSQGGSFYQNAVRPNLFFHVGRLATFFILGGMLGLIGGEVRLSGNFISVFTFVIAGVMAVLGLNILGLIPGISQMGIRMPKIFSSHWKNLEESEHKMAPFFLGGLSFFLPCGFTQSMQIFALASGNFWVGAVSLLVFALGTVPALLILGITTSWTKNRGMAVFQKVAGIIVLIFALFTFNSAWALSGISFNVFSSQKSEDIPSTPANRMENGLEQTVVMHLTSRGFEPNALEIKKGIPVKWVIVGDQVTGCTNRIIIPSLNVSKNLSYGENTVKFTPDKAGEIPFSCWMGMVRGKFIVK